VVIFCILLVALLGFIISTGVKFQKHRDACALECVSLGHGFDGVSKVACFCDEKKVTAAKLREDRGN